MVRLTGINEVWNNFEVDKRLNVAKLEVLRF